ncbi:MAG TPA: MBL fold metallo-hydrolase [Sphingobacteriaceae bacterium]
MKITKLSWAGLKIESRGTTVFIDPVVNFEKMEKYMGKPLTPVIEIPATEQADVILLTHLHQDHYDPETIRNILKPGGQVWVHEEVEENVRKAELPVRGLELNTSVHLGDLNIIPVFALDGIGHEQVSWIVQYEKTQIFHGGDTLWHNQFWAITNQYGPMDLAFLPINGVTVNYPFIGYTALPASMTPNEAAVAGRILRAKFVVPMHYGMFNYPPVYTPYPEPENEFMLACDRHSQGYSFLSDGESYELDPAAPSTEVTNETL